MIPPSQRQQADEEEVPRALEELLAEEPGAGEAGQPVVERDAEPGRGDRVLEDVARDGVEQHEDHDRDRAHPDRRDARREVARMDLGERLRQRAVARHRERRARRRQDRRLRRGRRGGEHGDDQQLVPRRAEHVLAERAEHVVGVVVQEVDAVEGLRGERDDEVDREQQEGAHDRGAARRLGRVLGLLVDRDGGVPAPVDEDREQQPAAHRAERLDVERVEPAQRRVDAPGRMAGPDLDERDDREEDEDHDLRAEQPPLGARRGLDADVADQRPSGRSRSRRRRRPRACCSPRSSCRRARRCSSRRSATGSPSRARPRRSAPSRRASR